MGAEDEASDVDAASVEDSPYEEVRVAVRNSDGGERANTVRAWAIGLFFVTVGTGLHMFLGMRSPVIALPAIVVQLLAYPVGCLWARLVPGRVFRTLGRRWSLNPGPFTIKEHVVVTLMANIAIGGAYSTDALVALQARPFFRLDLGWGFALLFTLASQLVGIALTGLFRRFLVWPASMVWSRQFASCALFYALHDRHPPPGWRLSRYRWFAAVAAAMFCYAWLPAVLFRGLSVVAVVAWARPASPVVNQLFGGFSGLSLLPVTLDWTYVTAYLGDPLLAPTASHLNALVGLVLFVVAACAAIVYSGALYADYLPVVTAQTYDRFQRYYDSALVLGPGRVFDERLYRAYSPLFLPPALALNYGLSFAALTSALVHMWLHHRRDIWRRWRAARDHEPDVHMKMMRRYADAPDWWYGALLAVSLGLGLATALGYDSQLPWWAFFASIALALLFVIPVTTVLAVSNVMLGLNVLAPFLAGFLIPGRPVGVTMFSVYSTVVLLQAQTYSGDLKLAHYMKVPPRTTFWCQVVATVWAVFVQVAVMDWTLGHVDGICDNLQPDHFTCPNGRAFYSATVVWGVIGPRRVFGAGAMYAHLNWFWLLGAALPLLLRALAGLPAAPRLLRRLQAPVMLGAMAWLPPGTPLSYAAWAVVGLVVGGWVRPRWRAWWVAYGYTTAAALDAGLVLATAVVFLAVTLPGLELRWWGNVAVFQTLDARHAATLKTVPEGGAFGPETW